MKHLQSARSFPDQFTSPSRLHKTGFRGFHVTDEETKAQGVAAGNRAWLWFSRLNCFTCMCNLPTLLYSLSYSIY